MYQAGFYALGIRMNKTKNSCPHEAHLPVSRNRINSTLKRNMYKLNNILDGSQCCLLEKK